MLIPPLIWPLATWMPSLFGGVRLHRAALLALSRAEFAMAERLFECAAACYRHEVMVEPLARLRIHQLMGRVRTAEAAEFEGQLLLEVEARLSRLDRIESLAYPFERVDARTLLAHWTAAIPTRDVDLSRAA